MLLLDDLLLAPGRAMVALFEQLAKRAQDEFLDDAVVKQELHEIHSLLEGGQISETEFEGREGRLLERLEQIMKAKLQGGWGSASLSAPTDATFAGIAAFARDLASPAEDTMDVEGDLDPPAIETAGIWNSVPMVIDTVAIPEDLPEPPMEEDLPEPPTESEVPEALGRLFFAVADDPPPPPSEILAVAREPVPRPMQAAPPIQTIAIIPEVAPAAIAYSYPSTPAPAPAAIAYSYPPTPAPAPPAPVFHAIPAPVVPVVPTVSIPPLFNAVPPVSWPPPVVNAVPVQPAPPNVTPPDVPVRATMTQAVEGAVRGLSMLKMRVSSITSVVPNGEGWQVTLELVERKGVPDTSDLLGVYETFLDAAGNVLRYERTRIRRRCDVGG